MLRGRTRRDANEDVILDYFTRAGCAVLKVNETGAPDAVIFKQGRVWLIEIKQPTGTLRGKQTQFHARWQGPPIQIVRSVEDAQRLLAKAG